VPWVTLLPEGDHRDLLNVKQGVEKTLRNGGGVFPLRSQKAAEANCS
jgi:hypothetical protein